MQIFYHQYHGSRRMASTSGSFWKL